MSSAQFFNLVLYASLAWVIYMMTFRTKDWLDIEQANRKRNDRIMKGLGQAAKGGIWLLGRFNKK